VRAEAGVAQACAADMEAMEAQIRATIDETMRGSNGGATGGGGGGGGGGAAAGVSGGNGESSSLAHLASQLELHAAILDRLHMEKAEDVAATMEKLKHLVEAHATLSEAVADLAARQEELEAKIQQQQQQQQGQGQPEEGRTQQQSAMTGAGGGQDHHDLEARLLATLTTVGGQLSERIGVVEGALAVEDLEDGAGTPHYATL
jgi:hypothetical protein